MQKISTLIFSEDLSTSEVLKLLVSEFDNLELLEQTSDFSKIFEILSNITDKSLLIVDLSVKKQEKLEKKFQKAVDKSGKL